MSTKWRYDDDDIILIFNHTDTREKIDVNITSQSPPLTIERDSMLAKPRTEWETGDNKLLNQTEFRQLHVAVNGKNYSKSSVTIFAYNCFLYCPNVETPSGGSGGGNQDSCPGDRWWSNPNHWDSGKVPVEGENVYIRKGCLYIFDLAESPVYNQIVVEGTVIFNNQQSSSLIMKTKFLFNRGGKIVVGNSTDYPF